MSNPPDWTVVAVGTWLYDGREPRSIELFACPAASASSRWVEHETAGFVIDATAPIPETTDGSVYCVGATAGGEFLSIADAVAWADKQPWGRL